MCSSLSRTCKRFHTIDIAEEALTPRKLERTLSQKCNDDSFKTNGSRMGGDRLNYLFGLQMFAVLAKL